MKEEREKNAADLVEFKKNEGMLRDDITECRRRQERLEKLQEAEKNSLLSQLDVNNNKISSITSQNEELRSELSLVMKHNIFITTHILSSAFIVL